jgi:hypothetical protein
MREDRRRTLPPTRARSRILSPGIADGYSSAAVAGKHRFMSVESWWSCMIGWRRGRLTSSKIVPLFDLACPEARPVSTRDDASLQALQ